MRTEVTSMTRLGHKRMHAFAVALLAAAGSATFAAETTTQYPPPFPPVSTCPIQAGIKGFLLEHKLDPTSFLSVFVPSFAPAQLAVFMDPTKEVHSRFQFSTSDMTFRAWSFGVPIGAPAISPDSTNFEGIAIAKVVVAVDKIYTTCTPRPAIMVLGPVTSGTPVYGSMVGLPHGFSFSFDPSNPTNTNNAANVVVVNAGTTVVAANQGSVIVTPATTTANVTGGPVIQTIYTQLTLDGSSSTSDSGAATYLWSSPSVAVLDPAASQTRIQVPRYKGDFPVTLTVTNSKGQSSSSTVTVRYVGP